MVSRDEVVLQPVCIYPGSLVEMLHSHGGDGRSPAAHEVEGDPCYAGLVG